MFSFEYASMTIIIFNFGKLSQSASNAESSSNAAIKVTDCGGESYQDKTELWKPLNCLVEAANSTKSFKSSPQSAVIKSEHINNPDVETTINKTRNKEHLHKSKVQDEKNNSIQTPSVTAKARRLQGVNRKRKDLSTSAHALFDAASAQCDRRICPIWFQLLASFDQLWMLLFWKLVRLLLLWHLLFDELFYSYFIRLLQGRRSTVAPNTK